MSSTSEYDTLRSDTLDTLREYHTLVSEHPGATSEDPNALSALIQQIEMQDVDESVLKMNRDVAAEKTKDLKKKVRRSKLGKLANFDTWKPLIYTLLIIGLIVLIILIPLTRGRPDCDTLNEPIRDRNCFHKLSEALEYIHKPYGEDGPTPMERVAYLATSQIYRHWGAETQDQAVRYLMKGIEQMDITNLDDLEYLMYMAVSKQFNDVDLNDFQVLVYTELLPNHPHPVVLRRAFNTFELSGDTPGTVSPDRALYYYDMGVPRITHLAKNVGKFVDMATAPLLF